MDGEANFLNDNAAQFNRLYYSVFSKWPLLEAHITNAFTLENSMKYKSVCSTQFGMMKIAGHSKEFT